MLFMSMKLILDNKILDSIDMNYANPTATFKALSGIDHYRLMAYISQQFNNSVLFDIGTCVGGSAWALAFNPSNHVHSFDICDCGTTKKSNVTYHIGNILEMPEWREKMLEAPFISLDVDPHSGKFESEFITFLDRNSYRGILYMNDTFTDRFPELHKYWETITQKKINVTKVGHASGIVLFNSDDEIVIQ
jgi:hypothetical protein